MTAAALLGRREGAWDRFAEAPTAYPNLPALLRKARPVQATLFDRSESWPQDNEAAETAVRDAMLRLAGQPAAAVRSTVAALEREHAARRGWVWAQMGQAPLAAALQHLAVLAEATARQLGGVTYDAMAAGYAERGWEADSAVIDALAAVEAPSDVAAVQAALGALYVPWLEAAAREWQRLVAGDGGRAYTAGTVEAAPGACLPFSDGLRFDAGRRLAAALESRGLRYDVGWRLAALPTVTATAKRAASPAADRVATGPGLDPSVRGGGARVTAEVFRRLLAEAGAPVLHGDETGDPSGSAWTELGDIDAYAHEHGWKVARFVAGEVRALAGRVDALLAAGWRQVKVITDHGWLLVPGGLPKAELPEHLTELRKGRCARLRPGAVVDCRTTRADPGAAPEMPPLSRWMHWIRSTGRASPRARAGSAGVRPRRRRA